MSKRNRPEDISKQLAQLGQQDAQKEENERSNVQKQQNSTITFTKLLAPKLCDFSGYKPTRQKDLPQQFFRQEVVDLAKVLLGKVFVRQTDKGIIKAVIVQTQAYKAPEDKACHAYNNKKSERTKYFWLDGGHLYIYTIYMPSNICLNVVAGNQNEPEAVLIRAVQIVQGIELVKQMRKIKSPKIQDLSNGPGKVGQALAIDMAKMNGCKLFQGQFKIIDAGIQGFSMGVSRRVNIDYAEEWIDKPWRFFIQGNKFVSKVSFKPRQSKKK